ncbi:MAG: hypothetical protein MJ093_05800 [Saccharofermentans sp.]|nr:hypothetical protein [Saccharofermentans sp.]
MIGNKLKKLMSIMLVLNMALGLCACNIANELREDISNRMDINTTTISSQEIIRHIIDAVNDDDKMADSYSCIPENQLDGVTYSMYFEYINILRGMTSQYGKSITYFKMVPSSEVKGIVGTNLFTLYPGLICAELQMSDASGNAVSFEDPIYIFLVENNEVAALSNRWISGIIDIYNYGDHYMTMIDEQNIDGVFALLEPGYSENYAEAVVKSMANSLIEYYKIDVKSSREQYRIVTLVPNRYVIRIPETISSEGEYVDHFVEITKESSNTYHIDDGLPFVVEPSMFNVYMTGNVSDMGAIKVGNFYARESIIFALGNPKYEFFVNDDLIYEEVGEGDELEVIPMKRTVMMHKNIVFIFYAQEFSDSWEGYLNKITITGEEYYIGDDIHVGMSKTELLIKYPFMDIYGYEHVYTDETGAFIIKFVFDEDDILTEINLSKEL